MQHKISDFCKKINLMHEKASYLRYEKYSVPKERRDEGMIRALIDDIQALAIEVAHDRGIHPKMSEKDVNNS